MRSYVFGTSRRNSSNNRTPTLSKAALSTLPDDTIQQLATAHTPGNLAGNLTAVSPIWSSDDASEDLEYSASMVV